MAGERSRRGARLASGIQARTDGAGPAIRRTRRALASRWPLVSFALGLVGVTLALKALLLVFGVVAYQALADTPFASPRDWLDIWNRMDGPHYLSLAQYGYQTERSLRDDVRMFQLLGGTL